MKRKKKTKVLLYLHKFLQCFLLCNEWLEGVVSEKSYPYPSPGGPGHGKIFKHSYKIEVKIEGEYFLSVQINVVAVFSQSTTCCASTQFLAHSRVWNSTNANPREAPRGTRGPRGTNFRDMSSTTILSVITVEHLLRRALTQWSTYLQ